MPTSHRGAATRAAVVTTSAAVAAAIAALPATSSAPAAEPAAGPATATEVLAAPIPQPFATPAPAPVPVAATASAAAPAAVQVEAPGRRTGAAERKAAERKAADRKAAERKAAEQKAPKKKAASKKAAEAEPASSSSASSAAATALEHALDQKGDPYRWGATGPDAFDCSGLVVYAFSKAGVELPRTSRAQSKVGERVSKDALRPGDLVFFYSPVSHVGVYLGDGKIVHASTSGKPVKVSDMGDMEFHSARRV